MKKLVIAVALASMAMFASAAKVDWKISGSKDGQYYVYNGDYAAQITTALTNTELGGAEAFAKLGLTVAGDSTTPTSGTGAKSVAGSLRSGAGDYLTYLVVKPSLEGGSEFGVVSLSTAGKTYDGQDPSPGPITWTYAKTGTIAATPGPGPTPTPEPTSGLLLVLGMAGLALRRRRI